MSKMILSLLTLATVYFVLSLPTSAQAQRIFTATDHGALNNGYGSLASDLGNRGHIVRHLQISEANTNSSRPDSQRSGLLRMTEIKKAWQHRAAQWQLSPGRVMQRAYAAGLPNLRPYRPPGWSDMIVVSKVEGSYGDSPSLTTSDSLYVSFAVANDGDATAGSFVVDFYIDTDKVSLPYNGTLDPSHFITANDLPIGLLPAGNHSLKIVVDSTSTVTESDESDNDYVKTISITGANLPNLTPFQPGWSDKIVVSNVKGTHSDTSPLTSSDTLYADFCVINNGTAPAGPFDTKIYVDGAIVDEIEETEPLSPNEFVTYSDYPLGQMPAGSHTIKIVADADNTVVESSESDNEYTKTITIVEAANRQSTIFVPIVLSTPGLGNSFFTSEMVITNKGSQTTTIDFTYNASFGGGSGTGSSTLGPGQQRIVPDAISYLRSLGIPIPSSGNLGGTLTVLSSGLDDPSDVAITVRTTTAVAGGRAGLAYPGIPLSSALNETVYLTGLRQNSIDRSNVAVQNAGSPNQGDVVLRLTVFSGDPNNQYSQVLPDISLGPGGFRQISQILQSNGMNLTNGYVEVERISGAAPYYAYAVVNDQANSDGSFVFPIRESDLIGRTRLTLPVLVEANTFSSELVVTNWSENLKTLHFEFVCDAVQTPDNSTDFTIEVKPSEQISIANFVDYLRGSKVSGIGFKGPAFSGALFVAVNEGDLSGIAVSCRTSSPGGGGRFGLFYSAVPSGLTSDQSAWIYGLQQNAENRSNLAIVNTADTDNNPDLFNVDIFDGDSGVKVTTIEGFSLNARAWKQFGTILLNYAQGTTQGYAKITKTKGDNRFITYGVVNDGALPGQRTGDGAFISSAP